MSRLLNALRTVAGSRLRLGVNGRFYFRLSAVLVAGKKNEVHTGGTRGGLIGSRFYDRFGQGRLFYFRMTKSSRDERSGRPAVIIVPALIAPTH